MENLVDTMSKLFSKPKQEQTVHDDGCFAQPFNDHHPSTKSILPQQRFSKQILKVDFPLPLRCDDIVQQDNARYERTNKGIECHIGEQNVDSRNVLDLILEAKVVQPRIQFYLVNKERFSLNARRLSIFAVEDGHQSLVFIILVRPWQIQVLEDSPFMPFLFVFSYFFDLLFLFLIS